METKELQVVNFEEYAMTPEKIQEQVNVIQKVMKQVMKNNEHYGTIPGCGTKPTLLKPGAEKLCTVFRLSPTYDLKRTDFENGHREYEIICALTHAPSGQLVAQGLGLCSSMESKYRYRQADLTCPSCGKAAIIKGKKEFGGGWLCWAKKGGCGTKFGDNDEAITKQPQGKVDNEDIADCFNTVLKMAKKRAHVDAVLTATAASDIFTQDIEDMKGSETTEQPKPKTEPKAKTDQQQQPCMTNKDWDEAAKSSRQQKGPAEDERTRRAKSYITKLVNDARGQDDLESREKHLREQNWIISADLDYFFKLKSDLPLNSEQKEYEPDLPWEESSGNGQHSK